jgi:osmotically-inducible protein OsmY
MKITKLFYAFILALVFAGLSACAPTARQEGTGEYVDDSVITAKVKTEIFREPTLKASEINVETFKGRVQLSGFVSSKEDVNKAVEIARNVKGVVAVKNDMQLK